MIEAVIVALVVIVLLLLNGLYVAAEFAIIGVPRLQLEKLAEEHVWAKRLHAVAADTSRQDWYIAICQVGISLASLGLGMYAEHALAELLAPFLGAIGGHTAATVLVLLFLTFWHVVVGEMIPKSLALQFPLATARWVDLPMRLSGLVLAPLVWFLNHLGNFILRLLRLPVSQDTTTVYSPSEIRLVFEDSREEGLLDEDEHALLSRVLAFEGETVRQLMVPRRRLVTVPSSIGREELCALVQREQYSRLPVLDGETLRGVLHTKDLLLRPEAPLADLLRPLPLVPDARSLTDAFESLTGQRAHMAGVVSEEGTLVGLITIEDLLGRMFGALRDEFDDDLDEKATNP